MKRKFLVILLALASALCLVFGLSACAGIGGGSSGSSGSGKHTHHFVYIYNNDATCTEDGTETEHCDSCDATGETRVKEGTKLGHYMQEVQEKAATCTEDGVIYHWYCHRCRLNFQDKDGKTQIENGIIEPKLGHEMVQASAKEATCAESGYAAYSVCSRCGFTEESVEYTDALHVQYELSDDHYIVSGLDDACTDTEIVVPRAYKGLPVTSIGERAFYDCSSLQSITIPESVTSIENYAFYGCSSLQNVTLEGDSKLTSIGYEAFYGCSSLASIIIPAGVTSIGDWAFRDCSSLQSVTFERDSQLTSIGELAFYDCGSLTSITVPEGVTSIGEYAFSGCSLLNAVYITDLEAWCGIDFGDKEANPLYYAHHLYLDEQEVTDLHIPDGVTEIKPYAFYNCSSLTSITIPAGVTSIGNYAFYGTAFYNDDTHWSNDILYIGEYLIAAKDTISGGYNIKDGTIVIADRAFYNCSSLEGITIPASVTSIGEGAFNGCESLQSVTFDGDSQLTSIGSYAFASCSSLTSITIPGSVTSIGVRAFWDCYKLIEVWNYSALPIKEGTVIFAVDGYVAYYAKHVYTANEQSKQTVTEDGYIFYEDGNEVYLLGYKGNETSLTLPAASPSGKDYQIYQYAFYDCSSLTSFTIPASVTSIGSYAFYGCGLLQSVTFEGNSQLTSIGEEAFNGCYSLNAVYITDLEAWCGIDFEPVWLDSFYSCFANPLRYAHHLYVDGQEVTDLHIPNGVTEIKYFAFVGGAFTSVTIPASVTLIEIYAFYECSSLESVTFERESQLTVIGAWAFEDCSSLTSITIPASVTSIGDRAFYDCDSLTSITIQESGIWIGYQVFYGTAFYNDDTNWINDILYIGDYLIVAKETISGNVTIKEGTKLIANYAFFGCVSLESITIPEGVTSIGDYAFYSCDSLTSVRFEGDSQLTSIGSAAFRYCDSLESITIPASVTSIGEQAFYGCSSLTSVQFERTDGWKVSRNSDMSNAIDVSVSDPQAAAGYLKNTYRYYYWKRY